MTKANREHLRAGLQRLIREAEKVIEKLKEEPTK
jgi:hypothetical protein